jgi:dynein heavy chain
VFYEQPSGIDGIMMGKKWGHLYVETKNMKNGLMKSVDKIIETMKGMLQQQARTSCAALLAKFTEKIKKLQGQVRNLKEFAAFADTINKTEQESKVMFATSATVDEMYKMLLSFDSKINTAESVKWDQLHAIHITFEEAMREAKNEFNTRMPQMASQLEKNMHTLDDECAKILTNLRHGEVINKDEDAKEVLNILKDLKESLDNVKERSDLYTTWQDLFKVPRNELSQLPDALASFEARNGLWESISAWEDSVEVWKSSTFERLNIEEQVSE